MIVVFVVDTSPSMAAPSNNNINTSGGHDGTAARGISRLDIAKMSIENLARSMDKRIMENNRSVLLASAQIAASMAAGKQPQRHQDIGRLEQFDEFLLLSSSLQPDTISQASSPSKQKPGASSDSSLDGTSSSSTNMPSIDSIAAAAEAHASCGAGGRLLVGSVEEGRGSFGMMDSGGANTPTGGMMVPHPPDRSDFEHELKRLRTSTIPSADTKSGKKFPEWAGGANGLNAALSHGLGLLSRYRLTRGRIVENFGMGRLPWMDHQMTKLSKGGTASGDDANAASKYDSPLQPACLILLTDGECLRLPPEKGGGSLSLRFGNMPLREFYREPFRWDQRIFILHIADASTPPLHKSLRALCEVTGGAYMRINPTVSSLSKILFRISPPRPKPHSIPDPLWLPSMSTPAQSDDTPDGQATSHMFVNGGPICSFQCLEGGEQGMPSLHRAMLLFAGACEQPRWILNSETLSPTQTQAKFAQSPIWCMPEIHFPSKKLDTLPPRQSQPLLHYSRNYQAVGSPVFDPYFVMKALHHLEKLQVAIRQVLVDAGDNPPPILTRMIQRDVYICEWLGEHETATRSSPNDPSNATGAPRTIAGREHFPICVRGAGRPALSGEGEDNILNIGILHVPHNWLKLKDIGMNAAKDLSMARLPTLTLLPPDAHILIPLLIKVAEMELRILKKTESKEVGPKAGATAGLIKKKANSGRARFDVPDNWKSDLRAYLFRLPPYYLPAIRRMLRPMLPLSVLSLLNVDSQEALPSLCFSPTCLLKIQNGEKSARDTNEWLRGMEQRMHRTRSMQEVQLAFNHAQTYARPFSFGYGQFDPRISTKHQYLNSLRSLPPPWKNGKKELSAKSEDEPGVPSPISLLPSSCLLPYYESRRRWIFGGTGLATRGLHVEGVNNDGVNTHHYNADKEEDVPLIALAGVGADTGAAVSIAVMGCFKDRLNFAPTTFVDYGGSSAVGAAVTTASDGSPNYSVDDDVLPLNFFDSATGEFVDSPQARARARLMINFGNPFNNKRGGSFVPLKFSNQRPPLHVGENGPSTPPHDAYDSHSPIEGEAEAAFTGSRSSPPRSPRKMLDSKLLRLKRAMGPPPLGAQEKRRKHSPPEGVAKHPDLKAKPKPPSAPPSPKPPPPPSTRPPPPRRHSSSAPPPPPKPIHAQKPTPQKSLHTSARSHPQHPQANPTQKHISKPAPPKSQNSDGAQTVSPQITSAQTNSQQQQQQQQQPEQHQQDIATQLQNPGVKPKIKLLEGWIFCWSKSQKRWYFFDTKTNKSVWDPEHIKAAN